jgi:type II secretory pathway component PulF
MPVFNYKVRDKYGLLIKGRTSSDSVESAVSALRSLNYTIIHIRPISRLEEFWLHMQSRIKKVGNKEILAITRQLASMTHAGLPILTCLDNIIRQTQNPVLKKVFEQIYTDIESGTSFANAVGKHPRYFSKFFVSMINVGEITGRLDDVLNRLVVIGKQEAEIRAKIQSAMIYPCILLFLSLGVVSYLLLFVLPRFIRVYESVGVSLPLPTMILLQSSQFLKDYWWAVGIAAGASIYLFIQYRMTPQGRFNLDQRLLKVPIIGPLILKYNLARFSRTLGSLLKSGIAVLQGIAVTETTTGNQVLKTILKDLRGSILEGQNLSDQLKLSDIFPPMVIQMIAAGEQTGKLDDMLLDVADFYDIEVDYEIRNLTNFVEPLLLVFMGGMVLFMALAVLKPIFNLVKITQR